MINHFKGFLPLCLLMFVLTGCWDEVNIEERGFIFGTALDLDEDKGDGTPIIALTNQFVVPSGIGSPGQGPGEGKAYNNVTVKGQSMAMISRDMATMGSRLPFYGHLKILAFSEKSAKQTDLIPKLSDFFIREIHMRRGIKVFITEGEAKDILDFNPVPEKMPANFINNLLDNNDDSIETINSLKIGKLQSYLLDENSYVLPKLKITDGKVHSRKAAVFHGPDNKLVGSLNDRETKGYNLVTQENGSGDIKLEVDGDIVVYNIDETKTKMTLNVDDPTHVEVSIDVQSRGYLEEMFGGENVMQEGQFQKIGDKADEEMEKIIKETIQKSQKDLHVDILGVGRKMKQNHYKEWTKVRGNWEKGEVYNDNTTFHVTVNAILKDTGSSNRSREKETKKDTH